MKKNEEILKLICIELAEEFKYVKGHEDKRQKRRVLGFTYFHVDNDYFFVQHGTTNLTNRKKNGGEIEFRTRFGTPRIDIYSPNREAFVGIELNEDLTFSEAQIFYTKGIELFNRVLKMIKRLSEQNV